jgi:hypothetical protein
MQRLLQGTVAGILPALAVGLSACGGSARDVAASQPSGPPQGKYLNAIGPIPYDMSHACVRRDLKSVRRDVDALVDVYRHSDPHASFLPDPGPTRPTTVSQIVASVRADMRRRGCAPSQAARLATLLGNP